MKTAGTVAVFTGVAVPADDRGCREVDEDQEIALEDPVVLGDQVVLLVAGVIGMQRNAAAA